MKVKTGLGLDSHRFVEGDFDQPLILGGLVFDDAPAMAGNSDADVILHALTDAITAQLVCHSTNNSHTCDTTDGISQCM